jgi:hypothetical protein
MTAYGFIRACATSGVSRALAALAAAVSLSGCISTVALDHAVMTYDRTTADSVSKQLLLNIARARHNEPMHFTAISSIAATYKLGVNAGLGGAVTGERGGLLVPLFGASAEENPTISISPMQGEEFTGRLLTPFSEQKLTLLLRQGYDVDALLRLMGAELRLPHGATGRRDSFKNRPTDSVGYPVFRRVMAQLSAIQDLHALYVEPLHFQHSWTVPAAKVTPESFQSVYKDFSTTYDAAGNVYRVSHRITGRVLITNYDPATLSNEERVRLHEEAEEAPFNDILLDIRPGHAGGEVPIHGRLRLRSFHEILTFVGRGVDEEREYDVAPDPRTPGIRENPVTALEIVETRTPQHGDDLSVALNGYHSSLRPESGYQWNHKAFGLLYQLFQMSVSTAAQPGPAITIAK